MKFVTREGMGNVAKFGYGLIKGICIGSVVKTCVSCITKNPVLNTVLGVGATIVAVKMTEDSVVDRKVESIIDEYAHKPTDEQVVIEV